MKHFTSGFMNMSGFDALAESITARLNCEVSLISVTDEDALVAMGHSTRPAQPELRRMEVRDTICGHTVKRRKPVRVPDVGSDPVLRHMPSVSSLEIGAYLGVPLRLNHDATVGAVCALSRAPRLWRDEEQDYLISVADLAEHKINAHVLQYEQRALSEALAENDAILATLAQVRDKAVTVHNAQGDLVFANLALRTQLGLGYRDLLMLPRAAQSVVDANAISNVVDLNLPERGAMSLHVQVFPMNSGLTMADWRVALPV